MILMAAVVILSGCSGATPDERPSSIPTPSASPSGTPNPAAVTPLNPCEVLTADALVTVFGVDLGDGAYAESQHSEAHQFWVSSGCTWSSTVASLNVELAEARDFPGAEVVCITPIEEGITEVDGPGDRSWWAPRSGGGILRACTLGGIVDVRISTGTGDPRQLASAVAEIVLPAFA